tara:strand:+ start:300 stop:698 length:399 start_codon:yes stop_codon:yes gene_type:complete
MPNNLVWSGPDLEALRAEIRAVQSATEHRAFWGEPVGPGLVLAADHGVYLMGWHKRPELAEGERYPVAYAKGLNPSADKGWYDKKVQIMGGDDDAAFFDLSAFDLAMEPDVVEFVIRVSANSYRTAIRRKTS